MDIKLIAIDLDGTLLTSDRLLSEENRQAIQMAKEAGIQVVLCTGRPLRSMKYLLDEAGLKEEGDIAITYNGGLIQETQTGDIVKQITFNREQCLEIYELGRSLNLPVNFIDLDYVYEPPYPVGAESVYMDAQNNIPKDQALKFVEIAMEDLPDTFSINKIVMSRPAEELDTAIPNIPKEYHDKYNIYKSQDFILEVLPEKVDKGYSMRLIGEMLNLKKEQIMGIGDQENDLSLIENAGLGIAMENAIPMVKNAADYITHSNDDNGVAHAIYKFALNQ